jgi:hypothetical protein
MAKLLAYNHAPDIATMDFVVPTIGFDLFYAFVIVRLDRRDLVWITQVRNSLRTQVNRLLRSFGVFLNRG